MANAILAPTCVCVTPWMALPGEAQGGMRKCAGGRGVSAAPLLPCLPILSSQVPLAARQYGQSDNLCCCSQADGDNRHMWFCWLIKHETGAKPPGLRRPGLTRPDQRILPPEVRQSDKSTSSDGHPANQPDRQTDVQPSPDRGASRLQGPATGGNHRLGWAAGADKPAPPPCMSR